MPYSPFCWYTVTRALYFKVRFFLLPPSPCWGVSSLQWDSAQKQLHFVFHVAVVIKEKGGSDAKEQGSR